MAWAYVFSPFVKRAHRCAIWNDCWTPSKQQL